MHDKELANFYIVFFCCYFVYCIGECPFLPLLSENNVSYIISANGNTTLFVRCLNGEKYYIDCGRNGEWVTSTADICNNTFHNGKCFSCSE